MESSREVERQNCCFAAVSTDIPIVRMRAGGIL